MPKAIRKQDTILELARTIHAAADDTKAIDIAVLDLRKLTSFTDYIIVCSGTSDRQVQAIAGNIEAAVKKEFKRHPLGVEGVEHGTWVLLDYGDVVCHIFLEEARGFYQLENLWHDARRVQVKKTKKMPQLNVLAVGKNKHSPFAELERDYLERLSHYTRCEVVVVPDSRHLQRDSKIKEESLNILQKLVKADWVVLLDERGRDMATADLVKQIQEWDNRSLKQVAFVIGGAFGVDDSLRKKANGVWKLSSLTLPHELARVLLLEQLYRTHTILRGEKYHH